MVLGIIGVGVVGGTLKQYFENETNHELRLYDPAKKLHDDLTGCEAIFISVPVESTPRGQNLSILSEAVKYAKNFTKNIFIRSTVLPGTNDTFGTYAMPEFLTERRAYEDMKFLPLVFGSAPKELVERIFMSQKEAIFVTNNEAELAKFTHNCFGAFKVTYFNMIKQFADFKGCDFENVKRAANITGFLGSEHLQVPGPDGMCGYGGKCFPVNVSAIEGYLNTINKNKKIKISFEQEQEFFKLITKLNKKYRGKEV